MCHFFFLFIQPVFSSEEKTNDVPYKAEKLSVAAHSSFAEILICQLCVHPL